ncbi:MAG: type I-E CRISPR-associated endoribonuclease Cas2e [Planctomycetota bacterium]
MSMTVVVTRDVATRYRGFLASCMLEIAPGVYTSPRMTKGIRERVWEVLQGWWGPISGGSIVMTWRDPGLQGGQAVRTLGLPAKTLYDLDGLHLVFTPGPDNRPADPT